MGTVGAGGQVGTARLWHPPVRLGRQDVHTRPCFTQTQDIHFPRPLHRQQTGPADLGTPVDDGREPPDVSFVWPGGCSGRRPGGRDGVGGKRLLVRLSTRGDAIALACKYGQTRPTCGSLSAWSWWTWTQRCCCAFAITSVGSAICCACALDPRMQFA